MKTINILLVFLAVMLLAACDNKFGISDGTYSSVEIVKLIPNGSDSVLSFNESFIKAQFKVIDMPNNVKKASLTTTFGLLGGNGFNEEGYLDGKGHFIVHSVDNITMKTKIDTCKCRRNGDFIIITDTKGILKLTPLLRIAPPKIDDNRYVAGYCFKKNK